MGLFDIFNRYRAGHHVEPINGWPRSDNRPDLDADAIWEQIERANAPSCRVSTAAAMLIRQKMASDLGRTLGNTPFPCDINGTAMVIDGELSGTTVEVGT